MSLTKWSIHFLGIFLVGIPCFAAENDDRAQLSFRNTNFSYVTSNNIVSLDSRERVINVSGSKRPKLKFKDGSSTVAKYGYDFVTADSIRLRGGFNRLSKDAQVGVQVIVRW